jgi:hypothetical protein
MHRNPSNFAPAGESLSLDRVARAMARGMKPLLQLLAFTLTFTLTFSLIADSQLSEKSPFLPPGYGKEEPKKPAPVVQPQGPVSNVIEFRGIVEMGGVYQFSIYNKKEQKGYWLKENAKQDGISINSFDTTASTIVVVMNGRSERLTLMAATENPMPVAQAIPAATNKNPLPPQLQNQGSGNSNNRRVVPRRRVILPKKN